MVLIDVEVCRHHLVVDRKVACNLRAVFVAAACDQLTVRVSVGRYVLICISCLGNFALVYDHDKGSACVIVVWVILNCDVSRVWTDPLIIVVIELGAEKFFALVSRLILSLYLLSIEVPAIDRWHKSAGLIAKRKRLLVIGVELDSKVLLCVAREDAYAWNVSGYCLLISVQFKHIVVVVGPVERRCI